MSEEVRSSQARWIGIRGALKLQNPDQHLVQINSPNCIADVQRAARQVARADVEKKGGGYAAPEKV